MFLWSFTLPGGIYHMNMSQKMFHKVVFVVRASPRISCVAGMLVLTLFSLLITVNKEWDHSSISIDSEELVIIDKNPED